MKVIYDYIATILQLKKFTAHREVNEMHDAMSFTDLFLWSLLKSIFKSENKHIIIEEQKIELNM